MAELLTGFNGKRIFAERASQDSAGDCIRTTYLKKADLVTTQSDWEEEDTTKLSFIKNKPDLSTYATKSYVSENYPTKSYVSETYPTKSYITETFPTKSYVSDTYATKSYVNETFPTKSYVTGELDKKADLVNGATAGNVASITATGNLADSGISANDLVVDSDLAPIAFTGSYNDLVDKPVTKALVAGENISLTPTETTITISASMPPAQVQADWDQTDITAADYIKHKPTLHDHANKATLDQIPAPSADNNMLFYDGNSSVMEWVTWSKESFATEVD